MSCHKLYDDFREKHSPPPSPGGEASLTRMVLPMKSAMTNWHCNGEVAVASFQSPTKFITQALTSVIKLIHGLGGAVGIKGHEAKPTGAACMHVQVSDRGRMSCLQNLDSPVSRSVGMKESSTVPNLRYEREIRRRSCLCRKNILRSALHHALAEELEQVLRGHGKIGGQRG